MVHLKGQFQCEFLKNMINEETEKYMRGEASVKKTVRDLCYILCV